MKAAIFDMDGTLLDSMPMWHTMLPRLMEEWDLSPDTQFYKDTDIMSLDDMAVYLIQRFSLPITALELQKLWKEKILKCYLTEISPKPFVMDYIKKLKENNVKIALATLTEHHLCDKVMEKLGFLPHLDCILTTEDVGGTSKRQPDLYLKCASLLGASPKDSVVFEDSLYPIESALNAGFEVYGVEDVHALKHREEIRRLSTRYITCFSELLSDF